VSTANPTRGSQSQAKKGENTYRNGSSEGKKTEWGEKYEPLEIGRDERAFEDSEKEIELCTHTITAQYRSREKKKKPRLLSTVKVVEKETMEQNMRVSVTGVRL